MGGVAEEGQDVLYLKGPPHVKCSIEDFQS